MKNKWFIIIFLFFYISQSHAAMTRWEMTFFDDEGDAVGDGFFTYDLSVENRVTTQTGIGTENNEYFFHSVIMEAHVSIVSIPFTWSFDYQYTPDPYYSYWFYDEVEPITNNPGQIGLASRYTASTTFYREGDWLFGPGNSKNIDIIFDGVFESDFVSGSFSAHRLGWGMWEATKVPIPGAIWLFGTALIGLAGCHRFRSGLIGQMVVSQ